MVGKSYRKKAESEFYPLYGQVNKCTRWMPWQLEAMKDVGACEKLGGVGTQTLIPRCLNGETHLLGGILH